MGLKIACLGLATLLLAACSKEPEVAAPPAAVAAAPGATDAEKVLNVYNWSDYIDPETVKNFEARYGIKVNYDVFDANEVVETKLLAGNTGYDLVMPSAQFMERQIKAGVFQKLDKALLSNLGAGTVLHLQAETDVLVDGHVREEGVRLKHHVDRPFVRRDAAHVQAVDEDLAAARFLESGEHAQQRRLAATRATKQAKQFAAIDVQRDVINGNEVGEALAYPLDADVGFGCGIVPRSTRAG